MRKSTFRSRCSACGAGIDTSVTYQVDSAGHVYCVRCYLHHDACGKRYGSAGRSAEVLRIMTPPGATVLRRDPPAPPQDAVPAAVPPPPRAPRTLPRAPQAPPLAAALERTLDRLLATTPRHGTRTGAPAAKTAYTPFNAPRLAPLRCALACGHAARRLYEYRRPGDERLRPTLALVAEVAAAGNLASRTATTGRFITALRQLGEASAEADTLGEPALAAVAAAAEAALALLKRQPWRVVDTHAHSAYLRAEDAVRQALDGPDAAGVTAALDGQHTRAFSHARALWATRLS